MVANESHKEKAKAEREAFPLLLEVVPQNTTTTSEDAIRRSPSPPPPPTTTTTTTTEPLPTEPFELEQMGHLYQSCSYNSYYSYYSCRLSFYKSVQTTIAVATWTFAIATVLVLIIFTPWLPELTSCFCWDVPVLYLPKRKRLPEETLRMATTWTY